MLFVHKRVLPLHVLLMLTDWIYQGFLWCPWAIHQWFLPTGEGYEKPLCQKCVPLAKVANTKKINCMSYQHGIWNQLICSTCIPVYVRSWWLKFCFRFHATVGASISRHKVINLHGEIPTVIAPLCRTISYVIAWCSRAPTADDSQHDSHPDGSAGHHQGLCNRTQESQSCSKHTTA